MGAEPSKQEQERRVEAVDTIFQLIVGEARKRGRIDMVGALNEVYSQVSGRILTLMDILRRSEREAAAAAGKEANSGD
ncbi:hypothetical protein ES702_06304 [subsurface metagenome]